MTVITNNQHVVARRVLRSCGTVCALFFVAAVGGCAANGRAGEIPHGRWVGEGTLVYEYWKDAKKAEGAGTNEDSGGQTITRSYPTQLSIGPGTLEGRDVVEIDILSERGALPQLLDKTHLRIALSEWKRPNRSTVLYRLAGAQLNPSQGDVMKPDEDAPPASAICTTYGPMTLLSIQYGDNFVDTFRFTGDAVEKVGLWYAEGVGLIQWREQLRRDAGD